MIQSDDEARKVRPLRPEPPFVWPEPRCLEKIGSYDAFVPFEIIAWKSESMFGIVSALSGKGIDVLERWLINNDTFRIRLVIAVYPTCYTCQADLIRLIAISENYAERLTIRIKPCRWVTDRPTNALCFLERGTNNAFFSIGPSENMGFDPQDDGKVNFVFRADAILVESFNRYFTWLWGNSGKLSSKSAAQIPALVLPEGTDEGAKLWMEYLEACLENLPDEEMENEIVQIDPETGEVQIITEDGVPIISPSEEIGLVKLDQLTEELARLYEKGLLVSIDKSSKIQPLDAPLDPTLFGDVPELQRGSIKRKVSMRVSIIDKENLREINRHRQAIRGLLNKFSFGLADNMRWIPLSAKEMFESEMERVNSEGQKLISDLFKGDVDSYMSKRKDILISGINEMYHELGRQGEVSESVSEKIITNLKKRLKKAEQANFMPLLTFSPIVFSNATNTWSSPWGQAYSLLSDMAKFPREALTKSFFLLGLHVSEDDLIEAMDVAGDALVEDLRSGNAWKIKDRCKIELEILSRIERSALDAREKCGFVWRVLKKDKVTEIQQEI